LKKELVNLDVVVDQGATIIACQDTPIPACQDAQVKFKNILFYQINLHCKENI